MTPKKEYAIIITQNGADTDENAVIRTFCIKEHNTQHTLPPFAG